MGKKENEPCIDPRAVVVMRRKERIPATTLVTLIVHLLCDTSYLALLRIQSMCSIVLVSVSGLKGSRILIVFLVNMKMTFG